MSILTAFALTALLFAASGIAPVDKTFLGPFQRLSYVFLALVLSLILWIVMAIIK